jgi:hypothetical protein
MSTMISANESNVWQLVASCIGRPRTERLFGVVDTDAALLQPASPLVPRAEIAHALNLLLLDDLLRRVPMGALYVHDRIRRGEKLRFDHGAVRTVLAETGALPAGQLALTRILEPLGYEVAGLYPLDELRMTGRAWRHADQPETIAQFFVSELHPERFSPTFQEAVARVLATSSDPLSAATKASLDRVGRERALPRAEVEQMLPELVAAFDRQHAFPSLADYEALLAESREMAWIATEGNAFNHATDRVADVLAVADEQKRLGRPMKDRVEVSQSGRVVQTAFRAARVERAFEDANGDLVLRTVPGSFFEFITRQRQDDGRLDLGFDTGNAQGIFKMTAGAAA